MAHASILEVLGFEFGMVTQQPGCAKATVGRASHRVAGEFPGGALFDGVDCFRVRRHSGAIVKVFVR